jgi:diaminopimelate epimerase
VSSSGSDEADFNVRIFNPDGSEAGMSGNGTRCAASYLYFHRLWSKDLCSTANAQRDQTLLFA